MLEMEHDGAAGGEVERAVGERNGVAGGSVLGRHRHGWPVTCQDVRPIVAQPARFGGAAPLRWAKLTAGVR